MWKANCSRCNWSNRQIRNTREHMCSLGVFSLLSCINMEEISSCYREIKMIYDSFWFHSTGRVSITFRSHAPINSAHIRVLDALSNVLIAVTVNGNLFNCLLVLHLQYALDNNELHLSGRCFVPVSLLLITLSFMQKLKYISQERLVWKEAKWVHNRKVEEIRGDLSDRTAS